MSRRAFLGLAGTGLLTGRAAAASALRTRTRGERHQVQPDAIFEVSTNRPMVALSFDDGPDPAYTPRVLRLMHKYGARATFFVVGVNATTYPDLVAAEVAAGHSIGNHTEHHLELELLSSAQIEHEIDMAAAAIEAAGAPKPALFRPPKGYTDEVVDLEAHREGYRTVFWTMCVERFVDEHGVEAGVKTMLDRVRAGAVILAHDGATIVGSGRPPLDRRNTIEALPLLLKGLAESGLRVVDVPTLLRHRISHHRS